MTPCASCGHPPHVGHCTAEGPCPCGVCVLDGPTAPLERRIELLESEVRAFRSDLADTRARIVALTTRVAQLGELLARSPLRLH